MYGIENYWMFVVAGIILNITPGADTIYIATRSIAQGRKAGVVSVLGIGSGALFHTLFAALGLSAILASSALAFQVVKYVGAAYLVYLGLKTFLSKSSGFHLENKYQHKNLLKIYTSGLLTNLLNPKVALFYLSFLPQFINNQQSYGYLPFLILGGTFIFTGTLWCLFIALSASRVSKVLRNNKKVSGWVQKMSAAVFVGLGIHVAVN